MTSDEACERGLRIALQIIVLRLKRLARLDISA
jgi:hypothetical protein